MSPDSPSSLPTPRKARLARRIILFLILGAIVNVAVAWACAAWSPLIDGRYVDHPPSWAIGYPDPTGVLRQGLGVDAYLGIWGSFTEIEMLKEQLSGVAPIWPHDQPGDEMALGFVVSIVSGWPVRSGRTEHWSDFDNNFVSVGLIRQGIRTHRARLDWVHRSLPLCSLPLGFTINTLFYATLLYISFLAIASLKRRCRLRAGRCTRCGYDMSGLTVCPECGTAPSASAEEGRRAPAEVAN